jgi:hypothetical protein
MSKTGGRAASRVNVSQTRKRGRVKKLKRSDTASRKRPAARKGQIEIESRQVPVPGANTHGGSAERAKREAPPENLVEARKTIETLVTESSEQIVETLIEAATAGKLAEARYLFELAGLYPMTTASVFRPEDSLAYRLLKKLGLPTEPVGETTPHSTQWSGDVNKKRDREGHDLELNARECGGSEDAVK